MIGPIVQGSTRPIWSFTLVQDDNTPFVLTGATFTGVLYSRPSARAVTLTGAFSITSATLGTFTYSPVAGDVAEPGEWEIEIVITIGAQPVYVRDHVTILEKYSP
jgi:hypothetical protein